MPRLSAPNARVFVFHDLEDALPDTLDVRAHVAGWRGYGRPEQGLGLGGLLLLQVALQLPQIVLDVAELFLQFRLVAA